jgi:hypothetical protein
MEIKQRCVKHVKLGRMPELVLGRVARAQQAWLIWITTQAHHALLAK